MTGTYEPPGRQEISKADTPGTQDEHLTARTKLNALAAGLTELGINHRVTDTPRPLLRVWGPTRQVPSETIACVLSATGWEFALHPFGPVMCSAGEVEKPGTAITAARVVANRLTAVYQT